MKRRGRPRVCDVRALTHQRGQDQLPFITFAHSSSTLLLPGRSTSTSRNQPARLLFAMAPAAPAHRGGFSVSASRLPSPRGGACVHGSSRSPGTSPAGAPPVQRLLFTQDRFRPSTHSTGVLAPPFRVVFAAQLTQHLLRLKPLRPPRGSHVERITAMAYANQPSYA